MIHAAIAYWAMVFALGFVLGTIRVLWVVPMVGHVGATALELPVILTASWWTAGMLIERFAITHGSRALAMGVIAFALLLASECALGFVLSGQNPAQWISSLREPHGLLGLVGQIAFALMPFWQVRRAA